LCRNSKIVAIAPKIMAMASKMLAIAWMKIMAMAYSTSNILMKRNQKK